MSLNLEKFQSSGSLPARAKGLQYFLYDSEADTLGTVLAASFFDGVFEKLGAGDIISVIHPFGMATLQVAGVSALEVVTTTLIDGGESGVQAITGPGAADIVTRRTNVTSESTDAITLADGDYVGQIKIITLLVDGGVMTLTPATASGWTTGTFSDAGDTVVLEWGGALGWLVNAQGGLGTGPLIA